jgi:metal-sulfur cluster biosynthetic enzyme
MDAIGCIRDPERPSTLEELGVICEENITVEETKKGYNVTVVWEPTAPHCAFANNIGLSMLYMISKELSDINMKIDVVLKEGSHITKEESKMYAVDKQINDKERVAAAFENPLVIEMIKEVTETLNLH